MWTYVFIYQEYVNDMQSYTLMWPKIRKRPLTLLKQPSPTTQIYPDLSPSPRGDSC